MDVCEELIALMEGRNSLEHAGRRGSSQGDDMAKEDDIESVCRFWEEESGL